MLKPSFHPTQRAQRTAVACFFDATDTDDARKVRNSRSSWKPRNDETQGCKG